MTKLMSIGLTLLLVAAAYLAGVFLLQRSVMYPAPPPLARGGLVAGQAAAVVPLHQPAGAVDALFLPATSGGSGPWPLLIFTHGNGELAEYWVDEFTEPRSWGWAVLLLEYPGYGGSAGKPSEASIHAVASAAHAWARGDARIDARRIVAYGRSLGSGPAARLAADAGLAGLILESAFTSTRPLAARFLVPGFLVRDPFDNVAALRRYRGPLLVLHGRQDAIIPIEHGRTLAAAVPGAEFHELPCGHNDCERPWSVIKTFLTGRQ